MTMSFTPLGSKGGLGILGTDSIEEVPQPEGYYGPASGLMANVSLEESRSRAPSTAPGQLTVKASVVVSFDLR